MANDESQKKELKSSWRFMQVMMRWLRPRMLDEKGNGQPLVKLAVQTQTNLRKLIRFDSREGEPAPAQKMGGGDRNQNADQRCKHSHDRHRGEG